MEENLIASVLVIAFVGSFIGLTYGGYQNDKVRWAREERQNKIDDCRNQFYKQNPDRGRCYDCKAFRDLERCLNTKVKYKDECFSDFGISVEKEKTFVDEWCKGKGVAYE